MDRAGITVSAVHRRQLLQRQASIGGKLSASACNAGVDSSHGGSEEEKGCSMHKMVFIPPSIGAQKAQAMAEVCRDVAVNGFEPIQDVFTLKGW